MDNFSIQPSGLFLSNLLHFGRALRRLGISISSRQIIDLSQALTLIDITNREDFRNTTRSFLIHNRDQYDLFDVAFDLFWSKRIGFMVEMGEFSHRFHSGKDSGENSLGDQKITDRGSLRTSEDMDDQIEADNSKNLDLRPTYSPFEILRYKDFASYALEEVEVARKVIQDLIWSWDKRKSRRQIRAFKQTRRLDFRRAIRDNMNRGGEFFHLAWNRRKEKPRPIVILCDISGSMERYSSMFLNFMYALAQEERGIEVFVFGTRLTNITPALRNTDIETAFKKVSHLVLDWSGGTRIGESLKDFNYDWSRRVLGRGAIVIIISDGWDRGNVNLLKKEIGRLQRSTSRLIWLNPLAGALDYQPLVRGMQAALPFIDDFFPLNNLDNLENLAKHLGKLTPMPVKPQLH